MVNCLDARDLRACPQSASARFVPKMFFDGTKLPMVVGQPQNHY
jgi:hypothetical protein